MANKLFQEFYEDPNKVVEQLRDYIYNSGLSVNVLSKEIGIYPMTIHRALRDKTKLRLSSWAKLKKFMADKI